MESAYGHKRYILIKAMYLEDEKRYVPFWDLEYEKHEDYGEGFREKGQLPYTGWHYCVELHDVLWDIHEKKMVPSVMMDFYPDNKKPYEAGTDVLIEFRQDDKQGWKKTRIEKIEYDDYELVVIKPAELDKYDRDYYFPDGNFDYRAVYHVRRWKPTYVFTDGSKTTWSHQIALLFED